MKVPARIQPAQLNDIFHNDEAHRIVDRIWGKNTTFVAEAKNGKHYWVSYKFKDYSKQWIQLRLAKPVPGKPGYFFP
jgi:hypothetical protein